MRTLFLAIIINCLGVAASYAQTPYSIKGSVQDTASNVSLINSTIVVLNAKDSTLVGFTRATDKGAFSMNIPKEGDFILMTTYPDYADYVEKFSLSSSKPMVDFGRIRMTLTARLLQEVIIKGTAAQMTIKGDTTEFNATAFNIEPNSKVEDLLKQIPGMQVDKDGKITAHGVAVSKVLVDGEEFFGDDPTLVTKNIRGDMVDKVQVYDKKTDQATFTGIDDGQKIKTVNIKLKEDKKSGYFGKADAGAGNGDYYQGQAMFNYFKGKKKFSVYGTIANTAKTGLSWDDNSRYGGETPTVTDDGSIYFIGGGGDLESYGGRFSGEGIPETISSGMHYDGKWQEDKQSINMNYKAGSIGVKGSNNSINQNNLPTGIINSNSGQNFDNFLFRHKLDAAYVVKLDTTSELKITLDGTLKNSTSDNRLISASNRESGAALNAGTRTLTSDGDNTLVNSSILWNKKLKKKGRTISLTLGYRYLYDNADGYLNSTNNFYNASGTLDSIQRIDQYKTNLTKTGGITSNIAYTEPITKELSLAVNYGFSQTSNISDRRSFNQSAGGVYDILDRQFSNNFDLQQVSNQAGATFNYRKKKTVIIMGTRTSFVNLDQTDLFSGRQYDRSFMNWIPQASYQYNFSSQKRLALRYNGNTTQPGLNQLQPIRINNDPLNLTLGNPDLGPAFTSRLSADFSSYKMLTEQNIYLNFAYSSTSNPIVNNVVTDAAGKNTFQFSNFDKSQNSLSFYTMFGRKIPGTALQLVLNVNGSSAQYFNLINSVVNETVSTNISTQLGINGYRAKKFSIYANFGPRYIQTESSLQKQINNNGWGASGYFGGSVELPGKVKLAIDGDYTYQPKTQSFSEDFERVLINTSITKSFMKGEALKLVLSGNDILNQNTGFSRRATNNMITQNSFTTIRRYGMFSVVYDLSVMGGKPSQP